MAIQVFDPKGSILANVPSTSLSELVFNLLFCNRTANIGDRLGGGVVVDISTDRGGWWASPSTGSRLWVLMKNGKLTRGIAEECRQIILEALRLLQDEGIAGKIECSVSVTGTPASGLAAEINIHKPTGGGVETIRYASLWDYVGG